jgi:FtsP/CotA-like multicopper oxidase with cupredoxin domain
MLNRRNLIKVGAVAGVAAVAAVEIPASASTGSDVTDPITPPLFTAPLPMLADARPTMRTPWYDYYDFTMREASVELVPGPSTTVYSFNGQFPGPTIRARQGRPVVIRQRNRLSVPTATHLHGGHNPRVDDGYPLDTVAPGQDRVYTYRNTKQAAPLWYHDHAMGYEAESVYRGLAGQYIVTDDYEEHLRLPSGEYEVPLIFRDANIASDGTLVYNPSNPKGDDRTTMLVNGRATPYFEVAARKYRFRMSNYANERAFILQLADQSEVTLIGSDGGFLPQAQTLNTISMWPAERADVIIDFSRYPVGTQIVLQNTTHFPGETGEIMRFDVVRKAEDHSRVPETFRAMPQFGTAVQERTFTLSYNPQMNMYLINGQMFDPKRVDATPKLGTTEVWSVVNADDGHIRIPHTFHTHLEQFRVLDRNGLPPAPNETGLKDTVSVEPGDTVRFAIQFTDYTGLFPFHCHMMEHSNNMMMGQMDVEA